MRFRVQRSRARGRHAVVWAAGIFLVVQVGASLWLDEYGAPIQIGRAHV